MNKQENIKVARFLKCVNEKNYAAAHKYLKDSLETKLKQRITTVIHQDK